MAAEWIREGMRVEVSTSEEGLLSSRYEGRVVEIANNKRKALVEFDVCRSENARRAAAAC